MLIREGVDDVLRRLIEVPGADQRVCELADNVIKLLSDSPLNVKKVDG